MIASVPKLARSELSSQCQNAAHSSSSGFNLLILDITFRNIDLGLPDEAAVGVDRRGAAADEADGRARAERHVGGHQLQCIDPQYAMQIDSEVAE